MVSSVLVTVPSFDWVVVFSVDLTVPSLLALLFLVTVINFVHRQTLSVLAPVLRETAKRGLIFVDDGASPRSVAGQIAGQAVQIDA